jgi:hypothetical protein
MLIAILLEQKKKARLITIPIGVVAFLYLGLASGTFGPLGNLFNYLVEIDVYPAFFQLFRSPVGFLSGYHIMFSILLIFGLRFILIHNKTQRFIGNIKLIIAIIFFLATLVPHTVWFTSLGNDIIAESDAFPDLYKENPEILKFYRAIDAEVDGNYRILMIPPIRGAVFMATDFQHARPYSEDPLMLWSPRQTIDVVRTNPYVKEGVDRLVMGLWSQNLGEILYYLNIYNIKYIIFRDDVMAPQWSIADRIDNAVLEKFFANHTDLFMEKKIGEYLKVYEYNHYKDNRIVAISMHNSSDSIADTLVPGSPLRIEPPSCSEMANVSIFNGLTNLEVEKCNNGFVSIVKPFLLEKDTIYKFLVQDFSINSPFHVKVYFQDTKSEQTFDGIYEPLAVHGRDAYYFYGNASTVERDIGEVSSLSGHFDTFDLGEGNITSNTKEENIYGYITIMVDATNSQVDLLSFSNISISQLSIYPSQNDQLDLNYTMINPTLWKLGLNTSKPFILNFHESYSPWWEASVKNDMTDNTVQVRSVLIHDGINSFKINETGYLDIELRYVPQIWFENGLLIAGITLLFSISCLVVDRFKSRIRLLRGL